MLLYHARSDWTFGYRDEELTKSSANAIVYKNGISTEGCIAWNRKNFVKCS